MNREDLLLGLIPLEQKLGEAEANPNVDSQSQINSIKNYLRTNNAPSDIVDIYFDADANALSDFKGTSQDRLIGLSNALPRGRETPRPETVEATTQGRDPRNLLTPQAGAAAVAGDMLAGGLEPLSEQKPFPADWEVSDQDSPPEGFWDKIAEGLGMKRPSNPSKGIDPITQSNTDLGRQEENISDPNREESTSTEKALEGVGRGIGSLFPDDPIAPTGEIGGSQIPSHQSHPTEHITSAFNSSKIFTVNGNGETNDMRDFAHAHDEIANPNIFTDLLAGSAKVFKQHLKDTLDEGAIGLTEGAIDKVFMMGSIPGGDMLKPGLKEAVRNYMEQTQESRYSRPLTDGKVASETKRKLGDPVMYPILILAMTFYLSNLSDKFQIPSFEGITGSYKRDYVMSLLSLMNVSEEGRQFAMYALQEIPPQLLEAFRKNRESITAISFEEAQAIKNYLLKIEMKYNELFEEQFYFALERENAGDTLKSLLDNLENPHTLHEIAMGIKSLDSVLYDVMNNDGLFLSLVAAIGQELRPVNMQKEFGFMHHLIEGIVYYDRSQYPGGAQYKMNPSLEAMMAVQNSKEDVAIVEKGRDVYVAFSGTKDIKKDFVRNIIRKGDSASQNDPKYNYTLQRGRTLIEKAKKMAQQKGGDVIILGYSLGSYDALYSSLVNPNIKTLIYHPYFSQNQRTRQLLTALKERQANLRVLTTREDPFGVGINYYKDLLDVGYVRRSKYHSPHALENHIR